jgi:hypothetical protein
MNNPVVIYTNPGDQMSKATKVFLGLVMTAGLALVGFVVYYIATSYITMKNNSTDNLDTTTDNFARTGKQTAGMECIKRVGSIIDPAVPRSDDTTCHTGYICNESPLINGRGMCVYDAAIFALNGQACDPVTKPCAQGLQCTINAVVMANNQRDPNNVPLVKTCSIPGSVSNTTKKNKVLY